MILKLLRALWELRKWELIPKLPRGMLAESYRALHEDEARVAARLGARSPTGVKVALKRAGVGTIPELVAQLDHFTPRRRLLRRLDQMIDRATYSTPYHPYQRAIVTDARRAHRRASEVETMRRIEAAARVFRENH